MEMKARITNQNKSTDTDNENPKRHTSIGWTILRLLQQLGVLTEKMIR